MQVSPEELRTAAGTIDEVVGDIGRLPAFDAGGGVLGTLGSFMQGSLTGPELDKLESARTKALRVVSGRYSELASVLRHSADAYRETDIDTATRLSALGDLNAGVR
ncbi:type VII secretion target [Nocardia rosealba]|uniref:type VII secretion target n=1 Tax=Nocardia rosealba TaxID=2878563 RepID=UPI001CDA0078|nr:type VII secretion target [Nocardia rosealba]MCA2209361.1 ESX-1 secretion-associated protein [Nocardia rosealba]